MNRAAALVFVFALGAPSVARAQYVPSVPPPQPEETVLLAPGVVATHYYVSPCWYGGRCPMAWRVSGLTLPAQPQLEMSNTFGSTRTHRVIVSHPSGVFVTDDLGRSWRAIRWDGSFMPLAFAFDPTSDDGVAVGENGNVWTTEDGGSSWRHRRDSMGRTLVQAARFGRAVAMADAVGGVWFSPDGGSSLRTLSDSRPAGVQRMYARFVIERNALWITTPFGVVWRADASGSLERTQ